MISKSRFINYKRCSRYCALEDIKKNNEKAMVSFEEAGNYENKEKVKQVFNDMFDEDGNDLIDTENKQLNAMMKYYNKVEMLAADAILKKFGTEIIYSKDVFEQKSYKYNYGDYEFGCFIDVYSETDDEINIYEVKATTTKKFKKIQNKKAGKKLFNEKNNIFYVNEDLLGLEKQYSKLFDFYNECGKYVYDLGFQRFVISNKLKELNINKKVNYYLVVLNDEYQKDISPSDDIIRFIKLNKVTEEIQDRIKIDIDKVILYLEEYSAKKTALGPHCQNKGVTECKFKNICFSELPKENSILNYLYNHLGFIVNGEKRLVYDLINDGYKSIEDISYHSLTRRINKIQHECVTDEKEFINKERINEALVSLKYPIYHLDFETFPCPTPRFLGETPYTQSMFQFSVHIESEPGVCDREKDHYGFLSEDNEVDDRLKLIESMLNVIDVNSECTVMVYNEGFEKTRIKELAKLFPEKAIDLLKLNTKVIDLMKIIKNSKKLFVDELGLDLNDEPVNYYHKKLNGSYSIKKLLPLFSELSYNGLQVGNGVEAMIAYSQFNRLKQINNEEYKESYQALVEYCKLDTFSMFEILNSLRRKMK